MAHRLPKHGSKLICMIYHTQNNNFELIIVTILLSAKIYDFLKSSNYVVLDRAGQSTLFKLDK